MRPHLALRLIRTLVRADMILGLAIVVATFLAVTAARAELESERKSGLWADDEAVEGKD